MSIVTDSSGESPENVYAIHRNFRSGESLSTLYKENKGKYKNLKEALIEDIENAVAPMREKRESISDDDVVRILKDGSDKARDYASKKMADVRAKVGVLLS
jgi:tryptophanyl-tRNA synthetase